MFTFSRYYCSTLHMKQNKQINYPYKISLKLTAEQYKKLLSAMAKVKIFNKSEFIRKELGYE